MYWLYNQFFNLRFNSLLYTNHPKSFNSCLSWLTLLWVVYDWLSRLNLHLFVEQYLSICETVCIVLDRNKSCRHICINKYVCRWLMYWKKTTTCFSMQNSQIKPKYWQCWKTRSSKFELVIVHNFFEYA